MLKLSKKIALPLIAVLILGTGVGGYFLFRNFQLPKYSVDKYPELLEYCDTMEDANGLRVSCKALILDIKPNVSEGVPSLTSLIITKDEELNEYTIAEEEAKFAFTNDILQFKKLKPVIINIQYTKINPIKYAVRGITFEDIPETYLDSKISILIEKIFRAVQKEKDLTSNLVIPTSEETADSEFSLPESGTIFYRLEPENSREFCPDLTVTNIYGIDPSVEKKYQELVLTNVNEPENLIQNSQASLATSNLEYIFPYETIYPLLNLKIDLPVNASLITVPNFVEKFSTDKITWSKNMTGSDLQTVNEISHLQMEWLRNPIQLDSLLIQKLVNEKTVHQLNFCGVINSLSQTAFEVNKGYFESVLSNNLLKISYSECAKILKGFNFDKKGLFLMMIFTENMNSHFKTFELCNKLSILYE